MIIFKVVFQTKQILSIFLEYLVEQSLLLQHEYEWLQISSRNQQTKIGFCIILWQLVIHISKAINSLS